MFHLQIRKLKKKNLFLFFPELVTRQHCRDNVTMFSVRLICLYSTCLLHLDNEVLRFFIFFLVPDALFYCRIVVVAKQTIVACPALLFSLSPITSFSKQKQTEETEDSQTERADRLIADQELEETDTVRNVLTYSQLLLQHNVYL